MRCSMGMAPSNLMVLPANRVLNNNKPQANIMDSKPMVNIMPFGLCRSLANPVVASATSAAMGTLTPMPCIPNTPAPWMPGKANVHLANMPMLQKNCKLNCVWAGVIQINFPGQMTVKDSAVVTSNSFLQNSIADITDLSDGKGIDAGKDANADTIKKFKYNDTITIKGTQAFIDKAVSDLKKLEGTSSGKAIINSIKNNKNGNKVTIVENKKDMRNSASPKPTISSILALNNWSNDNLYNGKGGDAIVTFYPNDKIMVLGSDAKWANSKTPSAILLGHELIHASHITNGNLLANPFPNRRIPIKNPDPLYPDANNYNWAIEERRTVGLGADEEHGLPAFINEPFSENSLRTEFGLPLRTSYYNPDLKLW